MTERPSALAVDRRGFIRLASTTAAGWLALGATSDRVRVVASLTALPLDDELTRRSMIDSPTSRLGGLIVGLRQRGWVEGVNFRLELRSTFGAPDKLKTAVQELLALKPDVILTGSTVETAAVLEATKTIPIVFATANDPVGNGFVESLAHPGGNVTGFTNSTAEMGGNGFSSSGKPCRILRASAFCSTRRPHLAAAASSSIPSSKRQHCPAWPWSPPPSARRRRSEERRVGKECRSRWSPYH